MGPRWGGWDGVTQGCPRCEGSRRAGGRAGAALEPAGKSSLSSSAVLMTQRLNLERDINTAAAAAQTLPGRAALTQGPLLLGPAAGRGPHTLRGLLGGWLQSPSPASRQALPQDNLTGVNRSCLTAFIFRSLFFLLWYSPQKDSFAIGKGSYHGETKKTHPKTGTIKG